MILRVKNIVWSSKILEVVDGKGGDKEAHFLTEVLADSLGRQQICLQRGSDGCLPLSLRGERERERERERESDIKGIQ